MDISLQLDIQERIWEIFSRGLMDRYKCECSPFMLSVAYTYGVIQGKREERFRRKNKKVGN